jgi:peptide/nickel transport system permease protein
MATVLRSCALPVQIVREISLWPATLKIGTAIVVAIVLAGLLAPWIAPYDPFYQDFTAVLQPPSLAHPFGTDMLGRDVFSRVLFGIRIDMEIGFFTTYVPMTYGVVLGALAGYYGGWLDTVVMRVLDVAMAFPFLVLIIVILAMLGPGVHKMLVERNKDYVLAARTLGYGSGRIIFRHALPNIINSSIVFSMADFVLNILLVSGLSFLGLGIQPPAPEWGAMIAEGRDFILQAWWISTLPGVVLVITGAGLSLIGDGLAHRLGERQHSLL